MIRSIRLSVPALFGFFRREIRREAALPWHQLLVRAAWLLGQSAEHQRVLRQPGRELSPCLVDDYFRVLTRPTLPYLSTAFAWEQWRHLHLDHCEVMASRVGADLYEQISHDGLPLWAGTDKAEGVSIQLCGPCPHREGGLTLVLKLDGVPIYRLAFSLIKLERIEAPSDLQSHGVGIYVGQVQGYPGYFDQIKDVTGRCRDIAPPDLLVSALLGLAGALGIQVIKAVSFEYCPSYQKMSSLASCFNYEQFWVGRWGATFDGRHYHLDLPISEKPISEIKANHRGRTLAKRRFKHEVADTVASNMWMALPRSEALAPLLSPYAQPEDASGHVQGVPASSPASAGKVSGQVALKACASGRQIGSPSLQTMAP